MLNRERAKKLALVNSYRSEFWADNEPYHVLLTLAQSYDAAGCFEEASRLLERAVALDPEASLPHLLLAAAYAEEGRFEEAALAYSRGTEIGSKRGLGKGRSTAEADQAAAQESLRRMCARYPANAYFQECLAELLHRSGGHKQAEDIYRGLLARKVTAEQRTDWEWRLSQVLIDGGNYEAGIPLMEQVLPRLGPGYDVGYAKRCLAETYLKAGRFERALEYFLHRGASSFPGKVKTHMLRKAAACYEGLKQHDKAIACLTEILDSVQERQSKDDSAEQKAVISDPRFYEDVFAALSRNYHAQGKLAEALGAFRREKEYHAKAVAAEEGKVGTIVLETSMTH